MPFIEAPTNFYLGRRVDPTTHRMTDDVVYYDSRDLTTHAVVLGMTGSGKTGLCVTLLEEAVLDNVPAIVIDPKGDITNLLLTFPDLTGADFQPWVNVDDARRAGMEVPQYAADVALQWRDGLSRWGIVPDRLRWLRHATQYSIYTPGSDAGLPISIVASFKAPREGWTGHEEDHRERINGIVTGLLALVGRSSQPLQDRDHVLLANLFEYAWQRGQDITLEDLILQIQKPPITRLGVFPINEYMSEKDRYKLAMDVNNIIAAPSFQSWINGEPMDVQRLLYQPDGRPRVSIFYIAHLSEPERQFMITLLLEATLSWMRTLSGTTSLRSLLYIDEMYGYFPPYPRNPPTKEPLLRLLKQARAFGLGLILATQNPGDLDYKGLTNAGTWFIGRLQSENDKQRVVAGLQSMATTESEMNVKKIAALLSEIEPRVFLMHNVHDPSGPILVHTRWAMNYLRGPLTRRQIQALMADQRRQLLGAQVGAAFNPPLNPPVAGFTPAVSAYAAPTPTPAYPPAPPELPPPPPVLPELDLPIEGTQPAAAFDTAALSQPATRSGSGSSPLSSTSPVPGFAGSPPPVPSTIAQYFLPHTLDARQAIAGWERRTNVVAQGFGGMALAYRPVLLAQVAVRYADRKTGTYTSRLFAYHVPHVERAGIVHWPDYQANAIDTRRVSGEPLNEAVYGELSPGLLDRPRMTQLRRELVDMLFTTARMTIPYNSALDIYANPDGDFSEFRSRVNQAARERRDAEVDAWTSKHEAILDRLDESARKTLQKLEIEQRELDEQKREELFTTGEAILGLLKGRTAFTLSRMSRSAIYRKRSAGDIQLYRQGLSEIDEKIAKVEADFEAGLNAINEKWAKTAQTVDEYIVTPYKKDILVELFGIGWVPHWHAVVNGQALLLPAYA